jgi:capsular polysaccharide biosynthesis protein
MQFSSIVNVVSGEPAQDAVGGASIAQYKNWKDQEVPSPPNMRVDVLSGPHIFPGKVIKRENDRHWGGQLILDRDFNYIEASYSLLDGGRSLPQDVDIKSQSTALQGTHFFLGSAHSHFGHFMLEGTSRLWAWAEFQKAHPSGKCIIYETSIPKFALSLLEKFGIGLENILSASQHFQIETLHIPTPSMVTHQWISNRQRDTWITIANKVGDAKFGPKVFLSRREIPNRSLLNESEFERIFASNGYDIICPETLSISDQINLAANSKTLVGCVGSQMYLAAFQSKGAKNGIIAPSNFFLKDDAILSTACHSELYVAFGEAVDFRNKSHFARTWECNIDAASALLESL